MKLLFLDTETTGLDPKENGVIQIAGVIAVDGEIKEKFNFRCKPFKGDIVSKKSLEVTGNTMEGIREFPEPENTYTDLIKVFNKYVDRYDKADKFYMVGQKAQFDYDFMDEWFKKNDNKYFYGYVAYHLVDLIGIATFFKIAGKLKVENMKLATLAESFGIELKAHDAMNDIMATREIFYRFVSQIKGGG